MAQALIRNLPDDVAADYKAAAKAKGRSLEAELRDLIVRNRPKIRLSPAEWRAEADRLAMRSKPGPDSTEILRGARQARFADDGADADR